MNIGTPKQRSLMVWAVVLTVVASACSGSPSSPPATGGPTAAATTQPTAAASASTAKVVVCELAYYTGSFAAYGPALTNDVRFPIEEVINLDPPLGRTWELVSEDIGDDHEGEAAKICLEKHKAEIVVSIAHQYRTY